MPEPDLSPSHEPLQPKSHQTYDGDDIELPSDASVDTPKDRWATPNPKPAKYTSAGWFGTIALLGVLVAASFYTLGSGSGEKQHPNWQHVANATEASSDTSSQLVVASSNGPAQLRSEVTLSQSDLDPVATKKVRAALANGNISAANSELQSVQRIQADPQANVALPKLTSDSELAGDLESGRKELYQIELFDCCDEDGDIVEVLVNGQSFATVPIMHAGTLLTIPLSTGDNSIVIRGARDGGGGVTLSVRTSQGEYFSRYLWVGQECAIGMHVQ